MSYLYKKRHAMRASLSSILINNGANIVFFYKSKKLITIKKFYIFNVLN
jgi:hypothetical protein